MKNLALFLPLPAVWILSILHNYFELSLRFGAWYAYPLSLIYMSIIIGSIIIGIHIHNRK